MRLVEYIRLNRPLIAHLLEQPCSAAHERLVLGFVLSAADAEIFTAQPDKFQTSAFADAITVELDLNRVEAWLRACPDAVRILPPEVLRYLNGVERLIFTLLYDEHGAALTMYKQALLSGELLTRGVLYEFVDGGKAVRYHKIAPLYKYLSPFKSRFWKLNTFKKILN